jgi:glycerol-3-phosphate dehydrogenase (NAD(P)+)
MKISVIGAGAWGTALANLLCRNHHDVTLWTFEADQVGEMQQSHRNRLFLPGIELHPAMKFTANLRDSVKGCDFILFAVPSKFLQSVAAQVSDYKGIAISVTKGIDFETGRTMSNVLQDTIPGATLAALSGPTLAMEVARNIPAAIVAAHESPQIASQVQALFHQPTFRVYTSNDVLGVELGGALKNVFAIAAGVSDGLGYGDNSKAAMVTRAIVEMRRLGVACGARPETFSGLSGLGDLTVTCFSKLSRNRTFGERLGRGEKVDAIAGSTITVAEGYPTARSAYRLARSLNVETPIIDEVHAMLYQGKETLKAVYDLMTRSVKQED